jgi:hypothetical protein
MKPFYKLMLKTTAIGGFAFVTASAGCSDTSNNTTGAAGDSGNKAGSTSQAGDSSHAGSNNSAGDGSGVGGAGASAGGAAGAVGGAGGAGGDAGPAVGKFCNTLSFGSTDVGGQGGAAGAPNTDVTLVLEVGEGAAKVKFEAISGTCAPMDGNACTTIPSGPDVRVVMYDKDVPTSLLESGTAEILPGENWIFVTELVQGQPTFDGGPLDVATCESVNYEDL